MAEEHEDVQRGFDRRALIKKGLLGAGIAAATPVIITFNTAAFASSVPGLHRTQFDVTPTQNSVTEEPETAVTCLPDNWNDVTNPADLPTISAVSTDPTVTFTLTGAYASCVFIHASANRGDSGCVEDPHASFTGIGTNQVVFDRVTGLGGGQGSYEVRLVVEC